MMSAGAAVFPHDGDGYEELLAAADSRMYRDKSERRRGRTTTRRNGQSSMLNAQ
jgi:GGDEF domain-containing protein